MDITTSPHGLWHHFDLPDAWAYTYKPSCGCVKYQAVKDLLHVYVHPELPGLAYLLLATLNDTDLLWNFRSCKPVDPSDKKEVKYYYGIGKYKPSTETIVKLKSNTATTFIIDTDNHSPGNYFWVAIPEKNTLTITDCLGHKLDGYGVDDNKTVEKIVIDGMNYLVYTRRSNIYISNVYTIKING